MDSDNENHHSKSGFYYLDEDFRHFRPFTNNSVQRIKDGICQLRLVLIGKNWAFSPDYDSRPCTQDLWYIFSQYIGPLG